MAPPLALHTCASCLPRCLPFEEASAPLVSGVLQILARSHVDYTIFFRRPSQSISLEGATNAAPRDLYLLSEGSATRAGA
jgi:hypothetical protein